MLRRTAWAVAGLVAASLVLPPLTDPQVEGVASGCADVVLYGARGTGQDVDGALPGFGREASSIAGRVVEALDAQGVTTASRHARYPAAGGGADGYAGSVAAGTAAVAADLRALARGCPDADVVVVAFSQGAQVVHAALADVPPRVARRLRAVVLVSDPLRDPADPSVVQETFGGEAPEPGFATLEERGGEGVPLDPVLIDPGLAGRVLSACWPSDPVCHAGGRQVLGMLVHAFRYEWGPAEEVLAAWALERLGADLSAARPGT